MILENILLKEEIKIPIYFISDSEAFSDYYQAIEKLNTAVSKSGFESELILKIGNNFDSY